MFRTSLNLSTSLADELRDLPGDCCAYVLEDAFLVVAAGGVFVMVDGGADLAADCERAATRATQIRSDLADALAWVPFVDAVVISDRTDFDAAQPALVIPRDLLRFTVCEGRRIVDPETVARLHLLRLPRLI